MLEITVGGYKSISQDTSVHLRGLTILSGANSSGKSSFMQPLLLIKQTVESNFETGSILLYGPNVKLTDSSQAFFRNSKSSVKSFTISIVDFDARKSKNSDSEILIEYSQDRNIGLVCTRQESFVGDISKIVVLSPDSTSEDIENQFPVGSIGFASIAADFKGKGAWKVKSKKCLLDVSFNLDSKFSINLEASKLAEKISGSIIHVPGIRGNPERAYRISASDSRFSGSFEPYVASIIFNLKNSSAAEDKAKFTELLGDIRRLGLGSQLNAKKINDTQIEIKISRFIDAAANDLVDIADVGFGVTQILPVVVALIVAKKRQIVYVEQPELHLHPKAQYELASVIAKAVNRGVLVVIETHSAILIRGIQTAVAQRRISPELIDLNWFTQDGSGCSKAVKAEMDAYGRCGEWPADFDEVSLNANKIYLDAVEDAFND